MCTQTHKEIKLKQCNEQVYPGFLGHMIWWSLLFINSTESTNLWSCLWKSLWNRFYEIGRPTVNVEGTIIHCSLLPECGKYVAIPPHALVTMMDCIFLNLEPKSTFPHLSCFGQIFILSVAREVINIYMVALSSHFASFPRKHLPFLRIQALSSSWWKDVNFSWIYNRSQVHHPQ